MTHLQGYAYRSNLGGLGRKVEGQAWELIGAVPLTEQHHAYLVNERSDLGVVHAHRRHCRPASGRCGRASEASAAVGDASLLPSARWHR